MPLCAPKVGPRVFGVDWHVVKEDAVFRIERSVGSKNKYRIIIRANGLVIGDGYTDEKQL